ncbi:ribbon-helix-helix protein, CopG family [Paenibacillus sp. D9]|uniref:ribbon-helix-helix protein, CopG family n=1 Tax=Paenibacillus sp. D9 TaxID=665792 RepID=UPI0008410EAB|nr:ribbon-helix-helix protein, CopG family [Paenibacillus sp. D9]
MDRKFTKIAPREPDGQLSMMFARGGHRSGAGRKAIGMTRKVSLTLSEPLWAEIDRRCRRTGRSRSEVLRVLLEAAVAAGGDEAEEAEEAEEAKAEEENGEPRS